jgi:hypothetical protein
MRRVEAILAVALAIPLAGCVLRGKPKTAAAVAPAPQPPPVAAAPAPPPEPLSIPQTQVQLPPEQPFDPEALVLAPPAETPPEAPSPVTHSSRSRAGSNATARAAEPPPPVAPPPATTEVTPPRPPIQEIVPASEQKRLQDSAQGRKKEIQKWLDVFGRKRMNTHQRNTVERIRSFVKDSDDAERRGDMREADALAERAEILMRELQNGQ